MALQDSSFVRMLMELGKAGTSGSIEMPRIVVIGDQSSGKSSVLERICGIPLPRSHGTCTRCPTEVRLFPSADGEKSCNIKIRTEWDRKGNRLAIPEEKEFCEPLTCPEDVGLALQRAQKATLNPGKPSEDFEACQPVLGDKDEQAFSKNLVVLEVNGAPCALTLVDLPGIISTTLKREDGHHVRLIKDMVHSFIKMPRTIIVVAISCKGEIQIQEAYQMAREVDPESSRTLGILTKPDMIEKGTHEDWLSIMRGEHFSLKLGYCLTRNPTPEELIRQKEGEVLDTDKIEDDFFREHPSMKCFLAEPSIASRLGVRNLMQVLSKMLEAEVKKQLPAIKSEVEQQLKEKREELSKLPKIIPHAERRQFLQKAVRNLAQEARLLVLMQGSEVFAERVRDLFHRMARKMLSSRPDFIISTPAGTFSVEYGSEIDNVPHDLSAAHITEEDVSCIVKGKRGFQLPTFTPYAAITDLINKSKEGFSACALDCFEDSQDLLLEALSSLAKSYFGDVSASGLEAHIRNSIDSQLEIQRPFAHSAIMDIIEQEIHPSYPPFTLGETQFEESLNRIIACMTEAKAQREEEPSSEARAIAAAIAFFKVAWVRFADNVATAIIRHLFCRVTDSLEEHIERCMSAMGKVGTGDDTAAEDPSGQDRASSFGPWYESEAVLSLAAPDPRVVKQRKHLEAQLAGLKDTKVILACYM